MGLSSKSAVKWCSLSNLKQKSLLSFNSVRATFLCAQFCLEKRTSFAETQNICSRMLNVISGEQVSRCLCACNDARLYNGGVINVR